VQGIAKDDLILSKESCRKAISGFKGVCDRQGDAKLAVEMVEV
jgi:hypothetical protein